MPQRLSPVTRVAIISGLVLCALLVVSFSPVNRPPAQSDAEQQSGAVMEKGIEQTFWWKTKNDPVSYWTFWLMLLTGVLSSVGLAQLRYVAKADVTARIAAEAAELSALVARDALHLAERAYLNIGQLGFDDFGFRRPLHFRCQLINHGRTPARQVRLEIRFATGDGLPEEPDYSGPTVVLVPAIYQAYPCHVALGEAITPKEGEALEKNELLFFIWGRIQYADIFGNPHVRGFAARYEVTGSERGTFSTIQASRYDYDA